MKRLGTVVAIALTLASGCSDDGSVRSVLLVTLDTTRADRIGCYGHAGAQTPNLDKLAASGVRFDQCVSTAPITLPAHASIFTGAYPAAHGVRYNGTFRLPDAAVTVAELLKDAGWRTAAFPAAYPVAAETGLNQGFEVYRDVFSNPAASGSLKESERPASAVSRDAIDWLAGVGSAPFFAWVHFYDPHEPYAPPEPYQTSFAARPYDGEIAFVDNELGRVFQALGAAGRWKETLVIVVGDHGEGLGEHREPTHKNLVYESTLRVPLIVKPPGRAPAAVVAEPVSLVDLAPTILDYAGITRPSVAAGTSLRPALTGAAPPRRTLFFESIAGSLAFGWAPLDGARRGPWKLIDGPGRELYDVAKDPRETENVATLQAPVADELAALLEAERRAWAEANSGDAAVAELDRESREQLESLGYIGGEVVASTRPGRNPRDLAHLETPIEAGKRRMKARDWNRALEAFRAVFAEDPDNRYALAQAAHAAIALRDLDAALAWARHQADVYPDSAEAWQLLGDVHLERREHEAAVTAIERAVAKKPGDGNLRYRLVLARFLAGDSAGAIREADRAVAAEPGVPHPNILIVAAGAKARLGDADGATRALADAVAQGFRRPEALAAEGAFAKLRALPAYRELLASSRSLSP